MNTLRRYLPLVLGVIILVVIGVFAPWGKVIPLVAKVKTESLVAMAMLAVGYYAAKTFRFWVMLKLLKIDKPLGRVALLYMAAQPVSVLPAGELYRTVLLEKELGVPVKDSAATITLQGLIEAVVLLGFSLAGAFVLGKDRVAVLAVAVLVILLLVALKRGWLLGGEQLLNKLPFVQISERKFRRFITDHQKLLSARALILIGGLSLIPVICGIVIFYIAAHAVGADITLAQSSIGYCLPVVLSGLSFLPGGIGASEGGTIGILKLINVGTAASFAITLLIRVFTLGAGMIFGLIALLITYSRKVMS